MLNSASPEDEAVLTYACAALGGSATPSIYNLRLRRPRLYTAEGGCILHWGLDDLRLRRPRRVRDPLNG